MQRIAAHGQVRQALPELMVQRHGDNAHVVLDVRSLLGGEQVPRGTIRRIVNLQLGNGELERLRHSRHGHGKLLQGVLEHGLLYLLPRLLLVGRFNLIELAHAGNERRVRPRTGLVAVLVPMGHEPMQYELPVERQIVKPERAGVLSGELHERIERVPRHGLLGLAHGARAPRPHSAVGGVRGGLEIRRPLHSLAPPSLPLQILPFHLGHALLGASGKGADGCDGRGIGRTRGEGVQLA